MFKALKRNASMLVTAVIVIGSLVGVGAIVLRFADRQTEISGAQLAAAQTEPMTKGLLEQPREALERATPRQFIVNRMMRRKLVAGAARLEAAWPTREAHTIRVGAARAAAAGERMMSALARHQPAAARAIYATELAPAVGRLKPVFARAERLMQDDVQAAKKSALVGTLAIAGAVGALLVLVMFVVVATRRRRERAETEERVLRDSEERLRALLQHSSDMVTVIAPDTTVLYQAGATPATLGRDTGELLGTRLTDWLHPEDATSLLKLCESSDGGGEELRLRHSDGSFRACEARATSLLDHPSWGGFVLNIRDVGERKALEERLRHQAFHDGLTGLANRALFTDRLEHAIARAERSDDEVAVMLIDLDDFKSVNDSLGHAAGDQLLQEVGRRLRESVRAADTVARLGGDEFGVIVEAETSSAPDEDSAKRILAAFARPVKVGDRSLSISASVGIARAAARGCTADQLVRNADVAMYSAKGSGKARWAAFRPEMHHAIQDRLQLKADLARAIAVGGQFQLHYQPIVTLDSGSIVGLEALVRWEHPTRGTIPPNDFIPLAEETGRIIQLGRWVLHEACRQGRQWLDESGKDLTFAVNVSVRQLDNSRLVDDVRDALAASGLEPHRLVIEITESELMTNVEKAVATLRELRGIGVRIAIDDFGTGYSSLSQLQRLPVDILKVDRVFADTLRECPEDASLLRAVLEIGASLKLKTIAEGIETPEQWDELKTLACPLGQGYLFAKPMTGDQVDALLVGEPEQPAREVERMIATPRIAATQGY